MALLHDETSARAPSSSAGDRPDPAVTDELVTVVIPALNEAATIEGVLDSVLGQTHRDLQVIVVDGVSTDGTADIVRAVAARDPRVELVTNPDRVIPIALNLAVERARSRWLVRVDAHCRIPDDYVERVVAHLRTGEHGGVGGRKNGRGRTPAGRAIAAAMGSRFGQGNSVYHYGTEPELVDHVPFGAYPVDVVRELGGWTETQLVNEDFEFDYRLRRSGRTLLFDPAIQIDWDCRQSVPALFHQYRRYGSGKVQTLARHPESAAVRHLAAPSLVAGLAVAALLVPFRRTRLLGLALAAPYLGIVLAGTVTTIGRVQGTEERLWVAPAFVAMHVGWGLGFWEELLAQLRRRGGARPSIAASRH
jgi:cellulose synthase/poly-beta-1,6-N-acetylglucosamine synthase-like glycosyltransferase